MSYSQSLDDKGRPAYDFAGVDLGAVGAALLQMAKHLLFTIQEDQDMGFSDSFGRVVVAFVILAAIFSAIYYSDSNVIGRTQQPQNYHGIVIKKYIDLADHGSRILVNHKNEKLYDNYYPAAFYELTQIGDSISKDSNSSVLYLIKKDTAFKFEIRNN